MGAQQPRVNADTRPGMRPLLITAVAWAGGVLLEDAARLPTGLWVAVAGSATLAAGAMLASVRWRTPSGQSVSIALWATLSVAALGCGATASALQRARLDACHLPSDSAPRVLEGTVARQPTVRDSFRQTLVDVDTMVKGRRRQAIAGRVRVSEQLGVQPTRLLPGDRVRFRGSLRTKEGYANPGAFSQRRFLGGRQIDRVAYASGPGVVRLATRPQTSAWRLAAQLGERASAAIDKAPPGAGRQILRALVLGDKNALPQASQDKFRRVGVAHVLAVSGLHLAAIALLVFKLVRRVWLRSARLTMAIPAERVAAFFAAPVAIVFTLMTGAQISTVRALIVTLAYLGAVALGRKPDLLSSLAFAALLILAFSPWAIFEASFQLSFVAAVTLALLAKKLGRPQHRPDDRALRRGARSALHWSKNLAVASFAVSAMTAPIVALHFGVVQPAGALSNIVIVPLAQFLVLPLSLVGVVVSLVWAAAGEPLVTAAAWAGSRLVALVDLMAHGVPRFVAPAPRAVELAAALLAGLAILTVRKHRVALACACAFVCVCSLVWTTRVVPYLRTDMRITFLDVGHGDAALIENPGGENWLVDSGGRLFARPQEDNARSGPGAQAVLPFLKARRIARLDLVVISHPHPDHYGGLLALIKTGELDIGQVWINGDESDDPRWNAVLGELKRHDVRIVRVAPGHSTQSGAARLSVLASSDDAMRSLNDNSIVARLDFAGRSVLFTGDIEAEGEQRIVASMAKIDVDVVKVPHHGSPTSSSIDLVVATDAQWVVISCGSYNRFGFPNADVVSRWQASGAQIMRTDDHGAVFINISPQGRVSVSSHKQ